MATKTKSPDFIIFFSIMTLLGIGIIMVFSASSVSAFVHFQDSYYFLKRQLIWAAAGLSVMIFFMQVDYHLWRKWAKPGFLVTVLLLILVLVPGIGKVVNGARRWIDFKIFALQPSELAKLAIVLYMGDNLTRQMDRITKFTRGLLPHLVTLVFIFGLILMEPDLGTALTIGGTVFLMFFVSGAQLKHLGALVGAGVAGIIAAIIAAPYRMQRITAFMDPWKDPLDTGYHIIQSLYALGSGGLFGVGLGRSREKFLYLPEPHTDFIFAVLGEELGFIGTVTVIALFFLFAWRGYKIAISAPDTFGSVLAAGLTTTIGLQAMMNIAVVTASMPVTGIPLPFISYGGSALLFTMAGVGVLLNISRQMTTK
ncbi:MAG TPA: stage V sporulation protein E [Negativicutes bacterium]|nr:stage V sporulation protein E [Negativicutes bacterium]